MSCKARRGCSVFTQSSALSPQHSPRYIERKEPEILSHLELVANTVRMEEALQQQQGGVVLRAEECCTQTFGKSVGCQSLGLEPVLIQKSFGFLQ